MKAKFFHATILAALTLLLNCTSVFAWNDFGHMTVAYIAYQKLSSSTKKRVGQLLQLHPDYQKWKQSLSKSLSEDEAEAEIFMLASTWPDLIRVDPAFKADGYDNGAKPKSPESIMNYGYGDHLLHKYWHHYDKPLSEDGSKLPPILSPNAKTQIAVFRKVLASKSNDNLKSYDLTWLLHLVGDMHQPLHCITRVSKENPEGDDCALKVMLNPPGPDSSLHWYFDCALGKGNADKAMEFAKSLPPADEKAGSNLNVDNWIDEGYQLAKNKVYTAPIGKGNGPFDLNASYEKNIAELAKQRAELAGLRLAKILNGELK
jgi:hypothetical protein